jgi:hypothetical protein
MALDPSIALGFQMPKFMSPMQAQMQALTLKQQMQNTQMQQVEMAQAMQTLRDQQAMSALYADPANYDKETGGLTPEAIAKIQNPTLRQKVNQDRLATLQKKEEIAYKSSESAKINEERQTKAVHDVWETALGEYEDVRKRTGNEKAAIDAFNKAQSDGYNELKTTGKGGFSDKSQFKMLSPSEVKSKLLGYKERATLEDRDKTPIIKEAEYVENLKAKLATLKPTDPEAGRVRAEIRAVEQHIKKVDAPPKYMINTGAQSTNPVTPTPGTTMSDSQKAAAKLGMTPDGLDIQAWNFINTRNLPYRKGAGGGADRNDIIVRRAAELAHELGKTPEELSAMPASFKADAQSLMVQTKKLDAIEGQLASFHNNLDTWDSLAKGIAPKLGGEKVKALASDLKKVDFTGVRSLDEINLRIKQQFNDPTASAVAVAAMAAAMDYARIMQGPQSTASLTEGARHEAERLINMAADEKGRKGLMAALESDTEGQVKGLRDQRDKIQRRLSGKPETKPEEKKTHTEAPAAAVNYLKSHPELKDQFKAKYGYLPEGM